MYYLIMPKKSHRSVIVEAGRSVMFRSGYNGTSVRTISAEAGVPLGSFTNHFKSKEAFASEVLDDYFAYLTDIVDMTLGDESMPALDRIRQYFQVVSKKLAVDEWERGCLIGDLSAEATIQSSLLREQLKAIFETWRVPFAKCIAEAQAEGSITNPEDPTELAEFILASWEGAILRMKTERSASALDRFQRILFQAILK